MIDEKDSEHATANTPHGEAALGFDEDDRLPWLESAADYGDDNTNTGRLLGFIILGLAALALLVGLVYWFQNRGPDLPDGDGSLIAAQEGDYKVAPDNPEMKEFEGTGDTSIAASEGETREGQLATPGKSKAAAEGGVLVQLGAFSDAGRADTAWNQLSGRYDSIKALPKKIIEANVEAGKVFRLNAVAPNAGAADTLCNSLKSSGESCQVVR